MCRRKEISYPETKETLKHGFLLSVLGLIPSKVFFPLYIQNSGKSDGKV